jgi:hypothetical protein
MLCESLPSSLFSDKVFHEMSIFETVCNTLSGVHYAIYRQSNSTPLSSFHRKAMLDDRTTRSGTAVFDSFGSSLPERGRILQQFYSQRSMVYNQLDSSFRQGRSVVLPRYRLLACWQSDQYVNRSGYSIIQRTVEYGKIQVNIVTIENSYPISHPILRQSS